MVAAAEASTASRIGEAGTTVGEIGRAWTSRGAGLFARSTGGAGRIGMGADRGMGSLAGGASGALQGTRFLLSSQAAVSSRGGAPRPPDAARPDVKQPSGDRR